MNADELMTRMTTRRIRDLYAGRWENPTKKQPFWEDLADKSKDGFRRNLSSPNEKSMARRPNNGGQHAASTDPKS